MDGQPGLAETPEPPYVAVVFSSVASDDHEGYAGTAARMLELAAEQPGYLGVEAAKQGIGITVSYWVDEAAAHAWGRVAEHAVAQREGRERWYADYRLRVATVTAERRRDPR